MASFEAVNQQLREGAVIAGLYVADLRFAVTGFSRSGRIVAEMDKACRQPYGFVHDTIEAGRLMAYSNIEDLVDRLNGSQAEPEKAAMIILNALTGSTSAEAQTARELLAVQPDKLQDITVHGMRIQETLGGLTVASMIDQLDEVAADIAVGEETSREAAGMTSALLTSVEQIIESNR